MKKPPLDIHHNQRIHPITSLGVCHNSDNSCIFAHSFVEFNSSFIEKPRFSAGNEVFLISFKNVFAFFQTKPFSQQLFTVYRLFLGRLWLYCNITANRKELICYFLICYMSVNIHCKVKTGMTHQNLNCFRSHTTAYTVAAKCVS